MVNLMLCGNDKVFQGMCIALFSVCKYTKEALQVYLITMDLTDIDENFKPITNKHCEIIESRLKAKNSESKVMLVDATKLYREMLINNANKKTHYTPYIFLRLLSDKIKEIPSKILYLDADIVCYKDIKELYDIDMEGYEIAAARDFIGRKWINKNYLNSGVVLINMAYVRKLNSFEACRKMCMERKMLLPDQTALNDCCEHKLILEDRFNDQKYLNNDTVIRHFSMEMLYFPVIRPRKIKPWEIEKVHNVLKINNYDEIYEDSLNALKEANGVCNSF